jgi:hypothetical protein
MNGSLSAVIHLMEMLDNPTPLPERTKIGQIHVEVVRDSEHIHLVYRYKRGNPPKTGYIRNLLKGLIGYEVVDVFVCQSLTIAVLRKKRLDKT